MAESFSVVIRTLDAMLVPLTALVESMAPDPVLEAALCDFRADLDAARGVDPTDAEQVGAARTRLDSSRTKLLSMIRKQ